MKITKQIVKKLVKTVKCGLTEGKGKPIPGKMCVEAAVCYALGLEHGDNPKCVGKAVRCYKIVLNDSNWSSNEARAAGMLKLAVAQLGSDAIDQRKFAELLAIRTVSQLLPELFVELKIGTSKLIRQLRNANSLELAKIAANATRTAVVRYAANSAYDAADAAHAAHAHAHAYANINAYVARYAADDYAARYAVDAARHASKAVQSDKYLLMSADIALGVLKELGSPGCEYLNLCEN